MRLVTYTGCAMELEKLLSGACRYSPTTIWSSWATTSTEGPIRKGVTVDVPARALQGAPHVHVFLMGNHEAMFLSFLGWEEALNYFGVRGLPAQRRRHHVRRATSYFEAGDDFTHAAGTRGVLPQLSSSGTWRASYAFLHAGHFAQRAPASPTSKYALSKRDGQAMYSGNGRRRDPASQPGRDRSSTVTRRFRTCQVRWNPPYSIGIDTGCRVRWHR